MSRAVCGVCFCPYGDEGDCACQPEQQQEQVVYRLGETDIYDFAGWLTCRKGVMEVGSSCLASPMADAVAEYIKTYPERFTPQPASKPWVGLTDEEIRDCNNAEDGYVFMWREDLEDGGLPFARAIEAKLKEKNA